MIDEQAEFNGWISDSHVCFFGARVFDQTNKFELGVPQTIESSTTTTLVPSRIPLMGVSFSLTSKSLISQERRRIPSLEHG